MALILLFRTVIALEPDLEQAQQLLLQLALEQQVHHQHLNLLGLEHHHTFLRHLSLQLQPNKQHKKCLQLLLLRAHMQPQHTTIIWLLHRRQRLRRQQLTLTMSQTPFITFTKALR